MTFRTVDGCSTHRDSALPRLRCTLFDPTGFSYPTQFTED